MRYVNLHTHSDYSNASVSFGDSIMKVNKMAERAKELGMTHLALTDHECLSGHLKFINACRDNGIFPILGNEIYCMSEEELIDVRDNGVTIPYYHLVLIALDLTGWHQLCELSTRAWDRAFIKRGNTRRVTTTEDIAEVIGNNSGHVVCTSACMGGEVAKLLEDNRVSDCIDTIRFFQNVFGEDNYYLEIQPNEHGTRQHESNKRVIYMANKMNINLIATTDAHMYSKEDKAAHAALKNSKFSEDAEGEDIYATACLMSADELNDYLLNNLTQDEIEIVFNNTYNIANRVEDYYDDLFRNQIIPEIPNEYIPDFKVRHLFKDYYDEYPFIKKFSEKDYLQERYAFYQIEKGLNEKVLNNPNKENKIKDYLERVNHELEIVDAIDNELGTRILTYYSTYSFIVDEIWKLGSTIAVGRGSAVSWEINWLIGANQLDPMGNPMLFPERHLNKLRFELPD